MIKNIITHSLRSLKRQKGYLLINILGLAIGIACSLLITIYVVNESGYDRFNTNADRIYRVLLNGKIGGQEVTVANTSSPVGPAMLRDFPEVENFCRINQRGELIIKDGDKSFSERFSMEADSTFFRIFSIKLLKGDPDRALTQPHTIVISESAASRIFGDSDPIGKAVYLGTDPDIYSVTGVMEDIPESSHFEASVISSFVTNPRSSDGVWLSNSFYTYLLLKENASPEKVNEKIPAMIKENVGPQLLQIMGVTFDDFISAGNKYDMYLQPLLDIHTGYNVDQGMKPTVNPKYLMIFGIVALLIIIIASINFMNLSTAQASKRAREIGIKKMGGSSKGILIAQFIIESVVIAAISLVLAVLIVKTVLPWFNNLIGANLSIGLFSNWYTIPLLILFTIIVGIFAGSYPAFYLSSISPFVVLRSQGLNTKGGGKLRSILVIFQFAASIILITGTLIMYRQVNHMLNKDLGFDKEQLLVISRAGYLDTRVEAFKSRVREIPGVINIAASTAVPGRNNNNNGYTLEGKPDEALLLETNWVDYDFLDTYKMSLAEGRFFDRSYPSDETACLLNESALIEYGITDLTTTRIVLPGDGGGQTFMPVLGVIKDFHFESLHNRIDPYIIQFRTDQFRFGFVTVRLAPQNMEASINAIEEIWKEFTGNQSLPYFFLDDDFARLYRQERQSATLSIIFAGLAILVASLGLFGLTSFMLQQRVREIGVRKAMGASRSAIFVLVSREILILVGIATVVAIPVIYYIAQKWLESYYFRIKLGPREFIMGFLLSVFIALATISFRTLKAAGANPARSLKHE